MSWHLVSVACGEEIVLRNLENEFEKMDMVDIGLLGFMHQCFCSLATLQSLLRGDIGSRDGR